MQEWRKMPLAERIRWLQWRLPLVLILVVILYQLGPARLVQQRFGHMVHYSIEIGFYSLVGPVVTWLTLVRIGRWLAEKEAIEQQARERERYLASITEASADAIISLDNDWRIRSWNRGAETIFGYAADEIVGQPFRSLLADGAHAESEIARLSTGLGQQGVVRDYEMVCHTQAGQRVVVELTQTQLLNSAGDVAGTSAILRDITRRKEREEIVNEERARIARDLHDGLAQNLYFLALKTDLCRKLLDREPARVNQELQTIKQSLQDGIQEVRSTIFALRPFDLRRLGFWRGTQQFVTAFGEQHELEIAFDVSGDRDDLPASLEPAVFRLIQESLNNVSKHAGARQVWIDLELHNPDGVGLTICDDGLGFDLSAQEQAEMTHDNGHDGANGNRSGLGLIQMRERVEALDGRFEVRSEAEHGTTVTAWFPVREIISGVSE